MGLENQKSSNKVYLSIVSGKVAQKVKEHVFEGEKQISVERKSKDKDNNEVIFKEIHYSGIGGIITNAKIETGKFGAQMVLEFRDDKDYHVTIPLKSSYAKGILFRIPNINQKQYFTIRPYSFVNDNNEKKVGVVVLQENCDWEKDKVPPYWTHNDKKDLPDIVVIDGITEGEKEYNDTERMKYLIGYFKDWASKIGNGHYVSDGRSANQVSIPDNDDSDLFF